MATATIITSPLYLDSPTGENRILSSGEMQGGGSGNGDALRGGPNYWTSVNVFAPSATFVVSGLAQFGSAGATRFSPSGDLQVSGQTLHYGPVFVGSFAGAARLISSGEISAAGGSGDATRTSPNFFTATNVFVGPVTISGVTSFGNAGASKFSASGDLLVSGTGVWFGPIYQQADSGPQRYVTSGELRQSNSGTVTSIVTGSNLTQQPTNLTTSGSIALAPSIAIVSLSTSGDVLISGQTLHFAPAWQGSTAAANRYVTSGELRTAGTGTVTAIATGSNLIQQPSLLTTSGSIALAPDIAISSIVVAGSTLASGVTVAFSPIYQGSQSSGARYLTSGEIRPDTTGVFSTDSVFWTGAQQVFSATTPVTISGQLLLLSAAYSGAVSGASRLVTSGELRVDTGVVATSSVYWTGAAHVFSSSTAVTVSGSALFLSPAYQGSVATANRYVTSGELRSAGTGTVTMLVGGSNLVFQPTTITVTGSVGLSPNLNVVSMSATGDVLVSGQSLFFSPLYQQSASGSNRYLTSGELRPDTTGVFSTDSVYWTGSAHVFSATTAVTFSGSVLALSPIHQGSVSTANRYVTSGELRAAGTGTVTNIVVGSNLQQQPFPLTTSGSIALNPDVSISTLGLTGNLLVSGTTLNFAPQYQGVVSASSRYVTSGEFPDASATVRGLVTTAQQVFGGDKYQGSIAAANRYVTSGELKAPGTGTVTSIVVGSNLIQQPTPLTTSGSIALAPDVSISTLVTTGATLTSGIALHFAPIFQGSQVSGNRYVMSGELRPDTGVLNTASVYWTGAEQVFSASTAVTISGQALFLSPAYSGSVASGNRFVTSGELRADAGVLNTASVYWTGAAHVFSATTAITISGQTLHLAPIYQGAVSGANRYLTSGELKPDTGITSINSQTGASQTMVTATTGNDFTITSNADVHTFALPDANQFSRGVISTGTQMISGSKTFLSGILVSGGLQVDGGLGGVGGHTMIWDGPMFVTAAIHVLEGAYGTFGSDSDARLVSSGELPYDATPSLRGVVSTDTQTISGAKTFLSPFSLASTLLVSGVTLSFAPQYQGSVAGGNRYVTSGELQAAAGGGDAQRLLPNFFTAANVFVGPVTVSGVTAFGSTGGSRFSQSSDLQVSGTQINYSPQYQGVVSSASRYVTSGEFPDASATVRGLVTTAQQVFGGDKYQGSVTGAQRYIVSGELRVDEGVLATDSVYWTGAAHVFSSGTDVTISGVSRFGNAGNTVIGSSGDVLISGQLLTFGSIQQAGGNQFAVSGYILSNVGSLASTTSLNPGVAVFAGTFGAYGVDLGYSSISAKYQTRIFAPVGSEVSISTTPANPPRAHANFTDRVVVTEAGTRILGNLQASGVTFNYSQARFGTALNTIISADGSVTVSGQSLFYQHSHFNPQANVVTEGGLQISGATNIAYQPIYQGPAVTGIGRYVVSGEMSGARVLNRAVGLVMVSGMEGLKALYSYSVPANTLTSGMALRFTAIGDTLNKNASTSSAEYRVLFGGVTLFSGAAGISTGLQYPTTLCSEVVATFSTSRQYATTRFDLGSGGAALAISGMATTGDVAFIAHNIYSNTDTTQAQLFQVYCRTQLSSSETHQYSARLEIV